MTFKPIANIEGRRFGSLVAIEEMPKINGMRAWRLQCDCGGEILTLQKNFVCGNRRHCGCKTRRTMHGRSNTPEYRHWVNMISRCENPNTPGYEHYGGRGVTIAREWRDSFEAFLAYVGPRPSSRHSIDRIDCNGHYEPGNVRWALPTTQARNTRVNRLVECDGERMTLAEAVERRGLKYNTVLYRILRGKSVEEALR